MAQLFAYVEKGVILECPVTETHIATRGHPRDMYVPVVVSDSIPIPEWHAQTQNYVLTTDSEGNTIVRMDFGVRPYTLEELFMYVPGAINLAGIENTNKLSPSLLSAIAKASVVRTNLLLDQFAATRGYDNIVSLVGYVGSHVEKFNTEGIRGKYLRDESWDRLYAYNDTIISKLADGEEVSFPHSYEELKAAAGLPDLTWEN